VAASLASWPSKTPGGTGHRVLAREQASIDRDARRLGLYRHGATENEEKVLFQKAGEEDHEGPLVTPAGYGRCFAALREQGQRRLALELAARPEQRRCR
jgi:hypothetical protein